MWWMTPVLAGVTVDDPTGCVDPERLDNEIRLQLGDGPADRLDIAIEVEPNATERHTRSVVRLGEERLWSRGATFLEVDCPAVPEALALSIAQGLARIPGWEVDAEPRRPTVQGTLHVAVSSGWPPEGRFSTWAGFRVNAARAIGFWSQARVALSPSVAVGSGVATVLHPQVAAGGTWMARGRLRPELRAGVSAGPLWAIGRGFDANRRAILPRAAALIGAGLQPTGPLQLGAFVEVPILRTELAEIGGTSTLESPVRVGLSVGLTVPESKTSRRKRTLE